MCLVFVAGPKATTPVLTSSRLSKTLTEVLHDKEALPYFIQFMATRKGEHLIKFWLDAESFQASSWTRIRSHSLKSVRKMTLTSEDSPNSDLPNTCDSSQGCSDSNVAPKSDSLHGATEGTSVAPSERGVPAECSTSELAPTGDSCQQNSQSLASSASSDIVPDKTSEDMEPTERLAMSYSDTCEAHRSRTCAGTDAATVPCGVACEVPPAEEPLSSPHTECGPSHHVEAAAVSNSDNLASIPTPAESSPLQSSSDATTTSVSQTESTNHSPSLNTESEDTFQEKLRKCKYTIFCIKSCKHDHNL